MAIAGINSEDAFIAVLNENLSASVPIKSIEHLCGRQEQSQLIKRALRLPGRSVFIYGDRGVGKTSLAHTSAFLFNRSDDIPEIVSIDSSSSFFSIVHDLVSRVAGQRPDLIKKSQKVAGKGSTLGLTFEIAQQIETGIIPVPKSINEAVALVEYFFPSDESNRVVVIDEFERLKNGADQSLFADFIKQVGDRELKLKFIFCGVADSLDDLLESHHSCYRYLEAVPLERLEWQARAEIIKSAADAFNVSIDKMIIWKISAISDGFPYYVHKVCEKLFWGIFDDEDAITNCTESMFNEAVKGALLSIEPQLKKSYELATRKYKDDYQEVLWAVADDNNLERRTADIRGSYFRIMKHRENPPMTATQISGRLNSLKKCTHGEILLGTRTGWYRFNENVIRGYVRLIAAQAGLQLGMPPGVDYTSELLPQTPIDQSERSPSS